MYITNPFYIQAIQELKTKYAALPWYKRFWFSLCSYSLSSALSKLDFTNPTKEQVKALFRASSRAWFFKTIFGILSFFRAAVRWRRIEKIQAIDELSIFDLRIKRKYIDSVDYALGMLDDLGLLEGEEGEMNRNAVLNYTGEKPWDDKHYDAHPSCLAFALIKLNAAGLLTGEEAELNRSAVANHINPHFLVHSLIELHACGLLAGEEGSNLRELLAKSASLRNFNDALKRLNEEDVLAGEYGYTIVKSLLGHSDPDRISEMLVALNKGGLLTQANIEAILSYQNSYFITQILHNLSEAGLLTGESGQTNFNALMNSPSDNITQVYNILYGLSITHLLEGDAGQANLNIILGLENPYNVNQAFNVLYRAQLLTRETSQARFDQLILHSAILCDNETVRLWMMMPAHLLTAARFDQMVDIATQHRNNIVEGKAIFRNFVNRELIFREWGHEVVNNQLNNTQSTHTVSVHKSVSESVTRLFNLYGNQLNGNEIKLLSDKILALPNNTLKNKAAKKCIQRLTEPTYAFTDPGSQVSTLQLLGLFWLAIHDNEKRQGSLEDAMVQLIDGLYEIQRGYNLSAEGVDDNAIADSSICAGGTFNKIMEKLDGLHPDVKVIHITKAGCALKFGIVVNEEFLAHFKTLSSEEIQKLSVEDALETVWPNISEKVSNRIFEEFGSLFTEDKDPKDSQAFQDYISTGVYVSLRPEILKLLPSNDAPECNAKAPSSKQGSVRKNDRIAPLKSNNKNNKFFKSEESNKACEQIPVSVAASM